MRTRSNWFVLCAAGIIAIAGAIPVLAAPSNDTATCAITASVAEIMEWETDFPAINLASITTQSLQVTGTATATLYTNGKVDITAVNAVAARLTSGGGATLVTEYSLAYDGNGVAATGGSSVAYATYDLFLNSASRVTHVIGDGAVEVTLGVRASNHSGDVSEATNYGATQTLTATWVP